MSADLEIREMSESAHDSGSLSTETSVRMDGASRLLQLADLALELGSQPVAEEAHPVNLHR